MRQTAVHGGHVDFLYVEDNDDNVYMLKNRLSRAGFTVIVATDGAPGVAMAASEQPDLIPMDLTLPGMPGRWADIRWPDKNELKATTVLKLAISEASAKIRQGPPLDDKADYALDCWAGVMPLAVAPGKPQPDPALRRGIAVPDYARTFPRSGRRRTVR